MKHILIKVFIFFYFLININFINSQKTCSRAVDCPGAEDCINGVCGECAPCGTKPVDDQPCCRFCPKDKEGYCGQKIKGCKTYKDCGSINTTCCPDGTCRSKWLGSCQWTCGTSTCQYQIGPPKNPYK